MAAKRFEKKVYECWAYEKSNGKLREWPDKIPEFDGRITLDMPCLTPIRVRVTVERMERRNEVKIARVIFNILANVGLAITGWSVVHSNLSIVSMAVVIVALLSLMVRWIGDLLGVPDGR